MTFALDDRWLWDFWHVQDGPDHHLFYLQAPRALGDPDLRHWNVTIGHAVSGDLERWEVLPDALAPGPPGAFDDFTTWTGSVVRHDGAWALLYTGTSHAERGLVQRVGLATSDDLVTWDRHGSAVIEADPEWYELLDLSSWHDQAWRDPWVAADPAGGWRAYVTARARDGDPKGRGVVGLARSKDLVTWEVGPPVTEPMGIGQLEVPQLVEVGGRTHLVFCTEGGPVTRAGTGTYALVGDGPDGPFAPDTLYALAADERGSAYAGKVVRHDGRLWFLAWEGTSDGARFIGRLSSPRPVELDGGRLRPVDRLPVG